MQSQKQQLIYGGETYAWNLYDYPARESSTDPQHNQLCYGKWCCQHNFSLRRKPNHVGWAGGCLRHHFHLWGIKYQHRYAKSTQYRGDVSCGAPRKWAGAHCPAWSGGCRRQQTAHTNCGKPDQRDSIWSYSRQYFWN